MYIIIFLIILFISGGYGIYKMSDGKVLKSYFHPSEVGREAAKEYLKGRK